MRFEGLFRQSAPFAAGAILAAAGIGFGFREHRRANQLADSQQAMAASMGSLRSQLEDLALRAGPAPAARQKAGPAVTAGVRPGAPRTPRVQTRASSPPGGKPGDDPRWRNIESRFDDQNRRIRENREELEGKLSAARDELNGSIAKTHEELVALEKRGQREYQEFTLARSKEFRKVGPLSLSLRKADTRHKRYDLELVVDDVKLQKKNVNLFEPVYLTLSDRPQPVELVVNQIGKNEVRGYLSLSKYKKSELVADGATRSKLEPPGAKQP